MGVNSTERPPPIAELILLYIGIVIGGLVGVEVLTFILSFNNELLEWASLVVSAVAGMAVWVWYIDLHMGDFDDG